MKKLIILSFLLASCAAPMEAVSPPSLISNSTKGPNVIRFELKNPNAIGKTAAGQALSLGGFSGLRYLGTSAQGKLRFLTHTDRGPNPEPYQERNKTIRPFLLPKFQPRIVYLEADPKTQTMEVVKEIRLSNSEGKAISGIPQNQKMENPVDLHGKALPFDAKGMDLEGIVLAEDGTFWMVEEYAPSVVHFSREGKLLDWLRPEVGLPKVLSYRRANRGFEGAARHENSLFAMMQSPLDNPQSKDFKNSKKSRLVRLLEIDLSTQSTVAQYAYMIEGTRTDKIGDIAVIGYKRLLVIEQDGKAGADSSKKVYSIDLWAATNLQLLPEKVAGLNGTLELMGAEEMSAKKILPVQKKEIFDLAKLGIMEEKVEGLDLVDSKFLAVVVDNDFAVGGDLDKKSGTVNVSESTSALYLIDFDSELD